MKRNNLNCGYLLGIIILLCVTISTHAVEAKEISNIDELTIEDSINNSEEIGILSIKPSKAMLDWGGLLSRSTFSNKSNGTSIYINTGNYSAAYKELVRIGGPGLIESRTGANGTTYIKDTGSGHVSLHISTSQTLGSARPTLSFFDDKIRFIGD